MAPRIVGAGLGRTGTHSLKIALERLLGGTCHHMAEVFGHPDELVVWEAAVRGDPVDWRTSLSQYSAIVDYPGAAVWGDIADAFPDALVLLSTRATAQEWWDSVSSTILLPHHGDEGDFMARWQAMVQQMFAATLGDDLTDADAVMAAYEQHNAHVRASVPADRLIEYQPGDGWVPLCAALGVDVPDEPFPRTNSRDEFRARAGLE